jgi:hypothetical protein
VPNIAYCISELQHCLADLQAAETQNQTEQAQVEAALKALGAAPAPALAGRD